MPFTKLLLVGWRLSGRTEVAFVIIICMYTYIFVKYKAYILKKLAESTHEARKIGGKSTKMATTKNRDKNI